eukprot:746673-Prymnesium_polylepis.1
MAWHRVVPQHRCAPVSVGGGTRCTFRAPSRGWRGFQKVRSHNCPRCHGVCDIVGQRDERGRRKAAHIGWGKDVGIQLLRPPDAGGRVARNRATSPRAW